MLTPITIDVSVMYTVIDFLGIVSAHIWYFLDNSFLITVGSNTYSLLDWFLIGGAIFDLSFEILDELMP